MWKLRLREAKKYLQCHQASILWRQDLNYILASFRSYSILKSFLSHILPLSHSFKMEFQPSQHGEHGPRWPCYCYTPTSFPAKSTLYMTFIQNCFQLLIIPCPFVSLAFVNAVLYLEMYFSRDHTTLDPHSQFKYSDITFSSKSVCISVCYFCYPLS